MNRFARLVAAAVAIGIAAASSLSPASAEQAPAQLRIGYQKTGDLLILKQQGTLAARLAKVGTQVSWVQFQSGPPLLEALNAGSIDVGFTGDTPPIFAQAAGAPLVYAAYVPSPGGYLGLLVHNGSRITTLADLKGKRIAFTKGSSAHNFVVRVLTKAHLAYTDIQPVYLQPADAAAAFQSGSIDAWAIWDPFYAVAQRFPGTGLLTDAQGIDASNSFYLSRKDYAAQYPATIVAVVQEVNRASHWAATHRDELAEIYSKETGVDLAAERVATARATYGLHFITPEVIKQQQAIADTFAKLGLIPSPIDIASIVWTPDARTALLGGKVPVNP
ncbi:MAG TPA: sulfonate ABC transporter substrate-binding protein [Candidatus Baltobacteraceae bacterium]